jgi:acyl-CoA reductase-like NAD-dependent aldehyde dehydrogenase
VVRGFWTWKTDGNSVTAGILPFNWPPIHTGGKIAPAIAAGKHPPFNP